MTVIIDKNKEEGINPNLKKPDYKITAQNMADAIAEGRRRNIPAPSELFKSFSKNMLQTHNDFQLLFEISIQMAKEIKILQNDRNRLIKENAELKINDKYK